MIKGIFKKADFVLMIALIVIGIASSVAISLSSSLGDKVVIEVHGSVYGTYSLGEDRIIKIKSGNDTNTVRIKDGKVSMIESSCKNQICVHHSAIDKTGQSIICLPNRVVVRIEGKGDNEYDAISN